MFHMMNTIAIHGSLDQFTPTSLARATIFQRERQDDAATHTATKRDDRKLIIQRRYQIFL